MSGKAEEIGKMGRIHSIETLGGADGPGLRMVIFMQGCPLRCIYCHNPDTWDSKGGREFTAEALVQKAMRYRTYFGREGGVTLSGGEPLMQPLFAAGLFKQLKKAGINTALDTAGTILSEEVAEVLANTDTVLLDIKMPDQERYDQYIGGSLSTTMDFLHAASAAGCRIWIRHVVIPGINDKKDDIVSLCSLIHDSGVAVERMELLPYHRMGIEKYKLLGLSYRLADVQELEEGRLAELLKYCSKELPERLRAIKK